MAVTNKVRVELGNNGSKFCKFCHDKKKNFFKSKKFVKSKKFFFKSKNSKSPKKNKQPYEKCYTKKIFFYKSKSNRPIHFNYTTAVLHYCSTTLYYTLFPWQPYGNHFTKKKSNKNVTNQRTIGLISADRSNKATLLLTIPRSKFKSSAKDLSSLIFEVIIQGRR